MSCRHLDLGFESSGLARDQYEWVLKDKEIEGKIENKGRIRKIKEREDFWVFCFDTKLKPLIHEVSKNPKRLKTKKKVRVLEKEK